MTDLQSESSLTDALREAAGRKMTPEEIREQRVSFVMGTIHRDSDVTREDVRRIIEEREGRAV